MLLDLQDPATPARPSVPRNTLSVQIAPLNYAFETIPSNERMNAIMNHELVHIVTLDQATKKDRFFRGLFGGKVSPVAEQPESMLYFYLTTPRVAAPRWFHEGSAVFVDTWMAGGIGRAQGGFDEMVFRAMVRDNAAFYDPLGAGVRGHQDRLPAPDQLVSVRHAVPHLAGPDLLARAGGGLDGAQDRQPRPTTPRSSVTSSGGRWKARGPTGSSRRRRFSRRTSRPSASTRSRPIAT